ncbi:DNA polymerase I [Bacillus safensis FO-36b] [Bacillus safensis subsp. safensis]
MAKEYGLNIALSDEKVYGKGAKQAIPPEDELKEHLGRKAAAIFCSA